MMPARPGLRTFRAGWLAALCVLAAMVSLCSQAIAAEPVQRKVLAIYDSGHEPLSSSTVLHYRAEMPLNHLGYIVDYHDIRTEPLPPVEVMSRYRAVVTWFTYDLERPTEYLEWAARIAESGVRFIVLGSIGGPDTAVNLLHFNRVLARIGVRRTSEYVFLTVGSVITSQDETLIGFERPLDPVLPEFPIIEQISPEVHVALEVTPPHSPATPSAVVAIGPGGAFVQSGFDIYYDERMNRSQWIVNPFELFRRALGEQVFPIPDTTTVSGRRLYFSHVDGDGWNNVAEMDRYRNPSVTAAEVMLMELIEPYPLPVAVGLVAGDLDPILGGGEAAASAARRIFSLPQVEVASHTSTHPFHWGFYENYDRDAELALLPDQVDATGSRSGLIDRLTSIVGSSDERREREMVRARYVAGGGKDLPRAYMRDPFGLGVEVGRAVRETEALAPSGKSLTLYQWSGDTTPFEAAIRATRRAGLRNINGGDSRFDDEWPSVGYVAPLSRVAGNQRQIYAVNSNENTYTNGWTENFHGYLSLSETLQRTEHPHRLKGVNVYYHTFSAEKQVSLNAVRTHLDWARTAKLTPIRASHYAAIADGFFSAQIDRIGAWSWRISERDGLQTVRFDDADELDVDFARSEGVVGRTRHEGSLYLALDETVPAATVTLRGKDDVSGPASAATVALDNSRWRIWGLQRNTCGIRHMTNGYGVGAFAWEGFRPGPYRIEAWRGLDMVWSGTATAGTDGRLAFEAAADAISGLEMRISCTSESDGA